MKAEVTEVTSGLPLGRIAHRRSTAVSPSAIIPSVFNKAVAPAVAEGVARAAHATGVARRRRRREVAPSS